LFYDSVFFIDGNLHVSNLHFETWYYWCVNEKCLCYFCVFLLRFCLVILKSFSIILSYIILSLGARGGAVGWSTVLQVGRSQVRFPMVLLEFCIDIILPAALWPWGWLRL
jgi:hypothetical protein